MENKYANWTQEDFDEAARSHKKKTLRIVLIVVPVVLILLGYGIYAGFHALTDSEEYKLAVSAIKADPAVQNETGEITDLTMHSAKVSSINGSSNASFSISVKGKKGEREVLVLESKPDGGTWKVDTVQVE